MDESAVRCERSDHEREPNGTCMFFSSGATFVLLSPCRKLSDPIANEMYRPCVYIVKAFGGGTQPAAVNGPAFSSSMRLEEVAYVQRLAYDPAGGVPPVV